MSQNSSGPANSDGGFAIIKKYSEASSIKCLPKFFNAKHWLQRTLWLWTLGTGVAFASFQFWGLMSSYLSYHTTMSIRRTTEGRVFPDVTLCNLNYNWNTGSGGLKAKVKGDERDLSYSQYIALMNELSWTYLEDDNFEDYQYIQTDPYTISGFVRHLPEDTERQWDLLAPWLVWKCIWEDVDRMRHNCSTIRHFLSPNNGVCYTSSFKDVDVERLVGMSVIVYLNARDTEIIYDYYLSPVVSYTAGVKVAFSAPGMAPEMPKALTLSPGHQTTVKAQLVNRIQMMEPYGKCVEDMDFTVLPKLPEPHTQWNYSKYACQSLCLQEETIKTCRCINSFLLSYSKLRSNQPFCGILDLTNMEPVLQEIRCAHAVEMESKDLCRVKCAYECRSQHYESKVEEAMWPDHGIKLSFYYNYVRNYTGDPAFDEFYRRARQVEDMDPSRLLSTLRESDVIERNFLQLNVLLEAEVVVYEDMAGLTTETMFGSLGGILNLWVGFTFITLAEIVDCVGVLLANMGRNRGTQSRNSVLNIGNNDVSKF